MLRRCLDWAVEQHTFERKRMGRGLQQLRQVGALLVPPPTEPDDFEDEPYGLRASKAKQPETGRSFLGAASDQVRPSSRRGGSGAKCQDIGLKEQAIQR